jgi:orotate phosphoribosyltransferase
VSAAPIPESAQPATEIDDPAAIAERVAETLLDIGAVSINHEQPYTYVSGLRSPIYTDNRLLISHPAAWRTVMDGFKATLQAAIGVPSVDVLAGTATSGIPHATLLADALGLPLTYVDFGEVESGAIFGSVPPGARNVMIEDLVTTGGSVIQSATALRAHGARVPWCLAIFTYDPIQARSRLQKEGLDFHCLTSLPTLLQVGVQSGRLTQQAADQVVEWVRDPQAWSARVR